MRLITNGFEFASIAGNSIGTSDASITILTSSPRQTSLANGGSRHLSINSSSSISCAFEGLDYSQVETYFKTSYRMEGYPTLLEFRFFDDATEVFKLRSASGGNFALYVGGVLQSTSTYSLSTFLWQELEIYSLIDVSGSIIVELDGVTIINYSGDTTTGSTSWNNFDFNVDGKVYFDDMIINNTYTILKYDTGNGVTPSGTLTGPSSSATIIHHVGDGVDGYIVLNNAGTAFSDTDAITDGSFSATANGDEETNNTSAPSTSSYIQLFFPNGNGTSSNLVGSDGDSTDNYLLVDDNEDTSGYVVSATPGDYDTYVLEDTPSDATAINFIEACFYSRKDGSTVTSQRSVIRHSAVDYESHPQTVAGGTTWNKFPHQVNPGTDTDWTISDIDSLEIGPEVDS